MYFQVASRLQDSHRAITFFKTSRTRNFVRVRQLGRVYCRVVTPGGWLSVTGGESEGSAVFSDSSASAEFYISGTNTTYHILNVGFDFSCYLAQNKLVTFNTS
jgi:hypothetical protein